MIERALIRIAGANHGIRGEKRVLARAGLCRHAIRFGEPDRPRANGDGDIPRSQFVVGELRQRGNRGLAPESRGLEVGRRSRRLALFAQLLSPSARRTDRCAGPERPSGAAAPAFPGEIRPTGRCSTADR